MHQVTTERNIEAEAIACLTPSNRSQLSGLGRVVFKQAEGFRGWGSAAKCIRQR